MHIAAYMAACDVDDMDGVAKSALRAVAGRIHYPMTSARVGTARLARDMGVHYDTAWRALRRVVKAGYLTVDNLPGLAPMWSLTPRVQLEVTPRVDAEYPPRRRGQPLDETATKDVYRSLKDRADAAARRHGVDVSAGEKPDLRVVTNEVAFAPGSGRLPNWSRGEQ